MTQSVPSRMALATSVASARVGWGSVMESSICVAVITALFWSWHRHDPLLDHGDLLGGKLHAQVTAGDHDPVGRTISSILAPFPVLDLGDDEGY